MTLRISGMASGLDTESVIEALVKARQQPIDTLQDQLDELDEIYEIWEEVDLAVSTLNAAVTDLCNYSTWNSMTLDSTDSGVVEGTVAGSLASSGRYDVEVTQLAEEHSYHSDPSLVSSPNDALGMSGTFTVNGVEFTVEETDSLVDIRDAINEAAEEMEGAGATASIIGTALVISSGQSGIGNELDITDDDGFLAGLGLFENETLARDLEATIDGIPVTSKSNDGVSDFVTGVTFNFSAVGSSTVHIKQDIDKIVECVETFVESYNNLMEYLGQQTEFIDSSEAATEDDEGKAGLLNGDSLANSIMRKCRTIMTQVSKTSSDINNLYVCGIWTEGKDNKLVLDEEKLRSVLASDFDDVQNLFRKYGSTTSDSDNDGVFRELEKYLKYLCDGQGGGIATKMNTINDKSCRIEDKIKRMQSSLETYEEELWVHYAKMEQMVAQIRTSADYVLAALGIDKDD